MPEPRPFRFGVQISNAPSRAEWVEKARKAEDLGYSTFCMPDHFGDQLAPIPALMAVADATSSLGIGMLVLDNDYRHPVVLAKEAATLDLLSDGRLQLGLGAGWERRDYEMSGISYDPAGTRIDRFLEGLAVVRGLLHTDGPFSFDGRFYTVTEMEGHPRPAQARVPILIGAGGPRMLAVAAREADIVSVNFDLRAGAMTPEVAATGTAAMVDDKLATLRKAAGDRFADLELSVTSFVNVITDDREGLVKMLAGGFGITADEALEIPFALAGSVEQIVETLEARRERWGFSYVVFSGGDQIEAMAPVVAALAGK